MSSLSISEDDLEKQQQQHSTSVTKSKLCIKAIKNLYVILLILSTIIVIFRFNFSYKQINDIEISTKYSKIDEEEVCPIGQIIRPKSFIRDNSTLERIFHDSNYRQDTIKKLSGAVKIPTISKDDIKSPSDPDSDSNSWTSFTRFHWFLESQFPEIFTTFQVEKVNKFGLLLTWEGLNRNLKPLLLMAHQDVVPIEPATLSSWLHPPFSGIWDEEYLYGRGSSDCKALIVGYFQALTTLIEEGYLPHRTIVISLGFDEEVGGKFGAKELAKTLIERYDVDSFFAILDEGGSSVELIEDGDVQLMVALPSIGEKGNVNLEIELTTPGGHSSIPPDHTNIGIIGDLITEIEAVKFPTALSSQNPTLNYLQCVAKYSKSTFPTDLKQAIFKAGYDYNSNQRVIEYLSGIRSLKYSVRTTQAIDVIQGGIKSNALPEYTKLIINHRIPIESSVNATIAKIMENIRAISDKYELGVFLHREDLMEAPPQDVSYLPETVNGNFQVSVKDSLSPARTSPTNNHSYDLFRGTIKHILKDYMYPSLSSDQIVVAGNLNMGNTDTRYYTKLSENIYRFKFSTLNGLVEGGTHSVNERVKLDDLIGLVGFVYEYVRNLDEFEMY